MRKRTIKITAGLVLGVLAALALVWAGRATAPSTTASNEKARSEGYYSGLRAGEAAGRQEGRALQEGASLPAASRQPVTDAFNSGYTAGANDAFGGGDGGWDLAVPYVVSVEKGSGQIVYRIRSHTALVPDVDYYLCPDGHTLCEQHR